MEHSQSGQHHHHQVISADWRQIRVLQLYSSLETVLLRVRVFEKLGRILIIVNGRYSAQVHRYIKAPPFSMWSTRALRSLATVVPKQVTFVFEDGLVPLLYAG